MKRLFLLLILVSTGPHALAGAERGKQLHDKQCLKCHDNGVYTRENRFISSREALQKQVQRCNLNVGAQWFDEDVNDVVLYLNESFYNFK